MTKRSLVSEMRKYKQKIFYTRLQLFIQDRKWPSNLQHLGQEGGQECYNQALRTLQKAMQLRSKGVVHWAKKTKLAGSNRRGEAAVNMTKLPVARRKLGKERGCKFSGNGSSQKPETPNLGCQKSLPCWWLATFP